MRKSIYPPPPPPTFLLSLREVKDRWQEWTGTGRERKMTMGLAQPSTLCSLMQSWCWESGEQPCSGSPHWRSKEWVQEQAVMLFEPVGVLKGSCHKESYFQWFWKLMIGKLKQENWCSCGSVVEHCVSSAKGRGFNSQGTHILIKKCIAWMHCKSLWIKRLLNA